MNASLFPIWLEAVEDVKLEEAEEGHGFPSHMTATLKVGFPGTPRVITIDVETPDGTYSGGLRLRPKEKT